MHRFLNLTTWHISLDLDNLGSQGQGHGSMVNIMTPSSLPNVHRCVCYLRMPTNNCKYFIKQNLESLFNAIISN